VGFDRTDKLIIDFLFTFAFVRYWSKMRHSTSYPCISTKPMIQFGGKYCKLFPYRWGTQEASQADYNVFKSQVQ
jgi:hypothetical protein